MSRGIDEGEEPDPPVRRGQSHDDGQDHQSPHDLHHRAQAHTRNKEESQRDDAEDHGRPHVGLSEDQHASRPGSQEHRSDDPAVRRILIETPGDEVSGEDGESELHELGGLETQLPEPDPTTRTLDVDTEPGHEHHEEEGEGRHEQDRTDPPELVVVESNRQPEHDEADGHPHGLADEDGPRRPVGGDGDDGGRRPHHDEPEDAEETHNDQEKGGGRDLSPGDAETDILGRSRCVRRGTPCRTEGARNGCRGGRTGGRWRHGRLPNDTRARPSVRSDTRCTSQVSRTVPARWWRVM